jgi:hypothetical protein
MSYQGLRDYLKTKLEAISSVGTVHDYYRFLKGKNNIQAALYEGGKLNAWFIRKVGEINQWEGPGSRLAIHTINLTGIMAVNDAIASEKIFLGIASDITDALTADFNYGGLCFQTKAPILKKHELKSFANILCHYATIELKLTERVNV